MAIQQKPTLKTYLSDLVDSYLHLNETSDDLAEGSNHLFLTPALKSKLENLQDNYKGYFQDIAALQSAQPSPTAGSWATLESTDTVWVWDSGTSAWVNTGASSVGDMLASIYDPQGVSADAFDRGNHTGTQLAATISDLNSAIQAYLDLNTVPNWIDPGSATATALEDAAGWTDDRKVVVDTDSVGQKHEDSIYLYEKKTNATATPAHQWIRTSRPVASNTSTGSANPALPFYMCLLKQSNSSATPSLTKVMTEESSTFLAVGDEIGGMDDDFTFIHKWHSGDFEIEMEVASATTNQYAKCGLMFRNSLSSNSIMYALIWQSKDGTGHAGTQPATFTRVDAVHRTTNGGWRVENNGSISQGLPKRLKLVRSGTTFTSFYHDGSVWVQHDSVSLSNAHDDGYIGICGNSNDSTSTAEFNIQKVSGL